MLSADVCMKRGRVPFTLAPACQPERLVKKALVIAGSRTATDGAVN